MNQISGRFASGKAVGRATTALPLISLDDGVAAEKASKPKPGSNVLLLENDALERHRSAGVGINETAADQTIHVGHGHAKTHLRSGFVRKNAVQAVDTSHEISFVKSIATADGDCEVVIEWRHGQRVAVQRRRREG